METIDHTTANPVANVLSGFYKNAAVGASGISSLLPEVEDMKLRRELFAQRTYYEQQKKSIRRQMAEIWLEPMESGKAARYWSDLMIRMKARLGMVWAKINPFKKRDKGGSGGSRKKKSGKEVA